MGTSSGRGWKSAMIGAALLFIAGCQSMPPTPSPTPPPTATPMPTAAPTVAPLPTLDDITLTMHVGLPEQSQPISLPADTRAQAPVTVHVTGPESVDLNDLEIGFQLFGSGALSETRVPLLDGQASTLYTSGEAAETIEVRLVAVLDVPQLGRVTTDGTLHLVRQTLDLLFSPRQIAFIDGQGQVTLQLNADPIDPAGQYSVAIESDNPNLNLNLDGIPYTQPILLRPGTHDLMMTYTGEESTGDTRLCTSLPERPGQPPDCTYIVWGPTGDNLIWQINPIVNLTTSIADMRLAFRRGLQNLSTQGSLCYDILIPPETLEPETALLRDWESDETFHPGTCRTFTFSEEGVIYLGYHPAPGAWMLRWSVLAPGLTEPETRDTIIAYQITTVTPPTGTALLLTDTAAIELVEDGSWDNLSFYIDQPLDSAPYISGLLTFYLPASTLNHGGIIQESPLPIRFTPTSPVEATLRWTTTAPTPLYILQEELTLENEIWHRAIFKAQLAAELLELSIIE